MCSAVSLTSYSLPYLLPSRTELSKGDCLIRKTHKTALQITQGTTTARLEKLGIYNTAEELIEAHLIGQLTFMAPPFTTQCAPCFKQAAYTEQRERALAEKYPVYPITVYVNAACYRRQGAYAVTPITHPNTPHLNCATVHTIRPTEATEAAIASALTHRPPPNTILSDSKAAIRNYASGMISPLALSSKILLQYL